MKAIEDSNTDGARVGTFIQTYTPTEVSEEGVRSRKETQRELQKRWRDAF